MANPVFAANPAPKRCLSASWLVRWERPRRVCSRGGSAARPGAEFHFEGLKVLPALPNVPSAVIYHCL